jgi:hypothetical protein
MLQWELLVTDGHVRAARWRAAAGPIAAIAVALIAVGFFVMQLLPHGTGGSQTGASKQAFANAQRSAAASFVSGKGAPPFKMPDGAEQALAPKDVRPGLKEILDTLGKDGTLPSTVTVVAPDVFWRGDWKPGDIQAVQGKHAILVGFYVNQMGDYVDPQRPLTGGYPPRLVRMFMIYHRTGGARDWKSYCLAVPQAVCASGESVAPASIPATLREVLPEGALDRTPLNAGGQ